MVELFGRSYTRREIEAATGRLGQVAGITPFRFDDGRAQGVRALRLDTGGLTLTCVIDRALDLSHAAFDGMALCWDSANGIAAPSYYEAADAEWLRTFFGGLLTTAGLTNFGPAGSDAFGEFGLHGRVNTLPAQGVAWSERWEGDECYFEVTGTVRQTRVFGENLWLRRTLRTRLGSRSLSLHDEVTNHGFQRTPHMILYHCNGGWPLLAPGARLSVSHSAMRPRDAAAEAGLDVWDQVVAPQPNFHEQVFIHTPVPLADGRAAVMLANRQLAGGLALAIHFNPRQLPALVQWRMLAEGTYVMGIEPANCPTIEGRVEAARRGTLPFLEPGEMRTYDLEFAVLRGEDAINRLAAEIQAAGR